MIVFLDTSVILAACGSKSGASREVFALAGIHRWSLISCDFAFDEVIRNLPKLAVDAANEWELLRSSIAFLEDELTFEHAVVFEPAKDRPVLFTAAAWSDVLLTLDDKHFGVFYEQPFYGLEVSRPGTLVRRWIDHVT